jgi:hypothetical protein
MQAAGTAQLATQGGRVMCTNLIINHKSILTIEELQAAIGKENVVIEDGYGELDGNCCLCPVDFEATAKKAGYRLKDDPEFVGDFIMTKESA